MSKELIGSHSVHETLVRQTQIDAARIEELERELAAERKRASSYKLLVSSMEKQKDIHLAERIKFRESLATLDSERAANERLTQERDALQADNARLRDKFEHVLEYWNGDENYRAMSDALNHIEDVVSEALAATPEQSLARIRNQVREECALEADRQSEDEPYGHAKFRCANIALEIRAMKEPE